jgi:hypothetical protein
VGPALQRIRLCVVGFAVCHEDSNVSMARATLSGNVHAKAENEVFRTKRLGRADCLSAVRLDCGPGWK